MRKRILILCILSLILQTLFYFRNYNELMDEETAKYFIRFFMLFYLITLPYLIYQCIANRSVIFAKNKISTSICVFFSLPVLIIYLSINTYYFKNYYIVEVFDSNNKSYKEVKWYYKTGELYSVEYWYSKEYKKFKNIKDLYNPNDTSKLNDFSRFSDEKVSKKDFIKDSIWYKLQKNGDTILKTVYKDNILIK